MRKVWILLSFVLPACSVLLSCGNTAPSSGQTSGFKYRAFISNNVSAGTSSAGVNIVDAMRDVRAGNQITAGSNPGMMVVTPNLAQTLVFSGTGTLGVSNTLTLVNNATESGAATVNLPGYSQSIVVSPDSSTAYVAVPTAQVVGGSPGVVLAVGLGAGTVTGQANVPAAQYIAINNSGNRILGFMANSDQIAVITPSQIGIGNAVSYIGGTGIFDRPVSAFFSSDDTTAYVVSCGAECGGTQASVQQYNLVTNTLVASVPACTTGSTTLCGASVALLDGSTLYVAGTPPYANGGPQQPCTGQTTSSTSCGLLTVIDLATMTVQSSGVVITDGYHAKMAMAANGQLFIGSTGCTEIATTAETRGCLSVYNTLTTTVGTVAPLSVFVPPQSGDATGLQPISKRTVIYVVQGGSLYIYDASFDGLATITNNPNNPGKVLGLVGSFVDVKTVN